MQQTYFRQNKLEVLYVIRTIKNGFGENEDLNCAEKILRGADILDMIVMRE
jgi:hypothetical protein